MKEWYYSKPDEFAVISNIHLGLGISMAVLAFVFAIFETLKLIRAYNFLVMVQLIFHLAVILLIGLEFLDYRKIMKLFYTEIPEFNDLIIILNSWIIIMSYFLFLLQLRLFEVTAILINLIFYVIIQSKTYAFIFLMMNFALGSSLHVLAMLQKPEK